MRVFPSRSAAVCGGGFRRGLRTRHAIRLCPRNTQLSASITAALRQNFLALLEISAHSSHVSLPNSYPTGYPTAYPTAYPTSFPTPPPSPVCKCGAATFRTSGGKMCSTTIWHGGLYFTTSWSGSSSPNSNCNNKRDEATNYLARDVCTSCGKCIGGQSTCTGVPTTFPTPIPTYPPGEGTSVRNFMLA